jgi:hypothetical protein
LLFGFLGVFAKRDFRPGFIISKNGDTLRGFILYKSVNASNICSFRQELKGPVTEYTPMDILAYRFDDGRYYIPKEITLEDVRKWVFVEFLIKGKANIYFMKDRNDHYFIEKDDGRIVELTEKEKIITEKDGKTFVKPEQYSGKLKSVLSDCPDIYTEIDRMNLNHSSLIRLAKDYHTRVCTTEECIVFERKKRPPRLRIGFYGGYTLSTIKFGATKIGKNASGDTEVIEVGKLVSGYTSGGLLGCRFEIENIFSSNEHSSIIMNVEIQRFSNYNLTEVGANEQLTYNGQIYIMSAVDASYYQHSLDVNLKAVAIKLPLMYNHTFLSGMVRPYVGAGVLNMFIISQNKEFNLDRFTAEFGKSIPAYHIGFIGSAGFKVVISNNHFFFFDLGYEYTQTTNVWPDLRFINSQFEAKLGFSL